MRIKKPAPRKFARRRFFSAYKWSPIQSGDGLDMIAVALLGQKELALIGIILLGGVAGDHAIEMRGISVGFGPQDAPEALGFFLAAAEGARDLDGDTGVGQVDREVGDLADHEHRD